MTAGSRRVARRVRNGTDFMRSVVRFALGVLLAGIAAGAMATDGATASAATYHVATSGSDTGGDGSEANPWRTISFALYHPRRRHTCRADIRNAWCLQPGDTLQVHAGTYDEPIVRTIGGTSWGQPVTIMAAPGEEVIVRGQQVLGCGSVVAYKRCGPDPTHTHYIVIDGLILDGSLLTGSVVEIDNGAGQIRIQNTEIRNGRGNGMLVGGGYPRSGGNQFINLDVHHNGPIGDPNDPRYCVGAGLAYHTHGMYINDTNDLIEGCRVHHNSGFGIHVFGKWAGGNTVRNNTTHNQLCGDGIYLSSTSNQPNVAQRNLSYGNTRGSGIGVEDSIFGHRIYDNVAHGNRYGILVGNTACCQQPPTRDTFVSSNICYDNALGDLVLGPYQSGTIRDSNYPGP